MRCKNCSKKLLCGIYYECRCGLKFLCLKCLSETEHNCSYDFKKEKIVLEKITSLKIDCI